MPGLSEMFHANQEIWNQRTLVHKTSEFYDVDGFLAGKEVLREIELSEVGDVKGKSLLHLQCHFGLDTLAWARHGAIVTGIDFSDEAIKEANKIAAMANLNAAFVCCNVYDIPAHLGNNNYDIIYTSYGVIGWVPDLDLWASVISKHLNPGGMFYMVEFHPVMSMFDDDFTSIKYSYHNSDAIEIAAPDDYTDWRKVSNGKEYSWNHSLSEVITALIKSGLQITQFNEYPYSPYPCFKNVVAAAPGKWHIKGLEDKIPMVFSITATPTVHLRTPH